MVHEKRARIDFIKLNSMNRLLKISLILFCASLTSNAQVYTGGNVSINYDNGMYIDAAPIIGYKWDAFNAGFSPFASYSVTNNSKGDFSAGSRIFVEYTIYEGIFLHGECEVLNYPYAGDRDWAFGMPLGAGYRYEIAKNVTNFVMEVLTEADTINGYPKEK